MKELQRRSNLFHRTASFRRSIGIPAQWHEDPSGAARGRSSRATHGDPAPQPRVQACTSSSQENFSRAIRGAPSTSVRHASRASMTIHWNGSETSRRRATRPRVPRIRTRPRSQTGTRCAGRSRSAAGRTAALSRSAPLLEPRFPASAGRPALDAPSMPPRLSPNGRCSLSQEVASASDEGTVLLVVSEEAPSPLAREQFVPRSLRERLVEVGHELYRNEENG